MRILCALLLVLLIKSDTQALSITPQTNNTLASVGQKVILSCKYEGAVTNLHWYRQYSRSKPEFLAWIYPQGATSDPLPPRILPKVDTNLVRLEIFDAEVSDSALYYCALTPDGSGLYKLIFGKGTTLIVETKQKEDPAYYKLDDSCLATDFTNHSDVKFSGAAPVRYSGKDYQNYYSSFALREENCPETGDCKEGSSGQSRDIERDEKINFISLGLFWLRILFLKTVVFNLLMTFKAWMS